MIQPSPITEKRNEFIKFPDGSEMELDRQMRICHNRIYLKACKRAVSRRYKN